MIPVAVSRRRPAGSGPVTEYVVLVGDAPLIEVLIGAIALPTTPLALAVEIVTSSGVVKLVVVDVVPSPPLLVATVVTR
jgi:hypothetical protein